MLVVIHKFFTSDSRHVSTSPRTVASPRHAASSGRRQVGCYIGTPRPMRSRVTAAGGRSPGLRVPAFARLPRNLTVPSGILVESSPLTVAGAATELLTEASAPRSLLIPRRGNHRQSFWQWRCNASRRQRVNTTSLRSLRTSQWCRSSSGSRCSSAGKPRQR